MTEQQTQRQILGLSRLAQLEWEARQAESPEALGFAAVNDTHRLVTYRHALLWLRHDARIAAVSGGLRVEPTAPQVVWFGRLATALANGSDAAKSANVVAPALTVGLARDLATHVEGALVWVPLTGPNGVVAGGLLLVRDKPASEAELRLLARVGSAYGHAVLAHHAANRIGRGRRWRRRTIWLLVAGAVAVAGAVPVQLTVLADAKVIATEPTVVAAPLDGVVKEIAVRPNEPVTAGQILVRFDPTELESARDVAAKRVAVLGADSQRSEAQAYRDPKALAEIGLLRAKLAEGEAELAWAVERLSRVAVPAERTGVVLFDDPNAWEGRPVKIGERIMSIADPRRVRLEIQLAAEDALVARERAVVELFLAISPTEPIAARLIKVGYEPRAQPGQTVALVAEAEFVDQDRLPRLGLTGTAKVRGESVSLAYALLRKPLAALRRMTGF